MNIRWVIVLVHIAHHNAPDIYLISNISDTFFKNSVYFLNPCFNELKLSVICQTHVNHSLRVEMCVGFNMTGK